MKTPPCFCCGAPASWVGACPICDRCRDHLTAPCELLHDLPMVPAPPGPHVFEAKTPLPAGIDERE